MEATFQIPSHIFTTNLVLSAMLTILCQ